MGTRGAWIERRDGADTVYYRQSDSYPDGWPSDMVKKIADTASEISSNTSHGPIEYSGGGTTMVVATDGFQLLGRDEGMAWLADSLFCEWAYCLNHDDGLFEVYAGFQRRRHDLGRYCTLPEGDGYYPVALVATFPASAIPADWVEQVELAAGRGEQ